MRKLAIVVGIALTFTLSFPLAAEARPLLRGLRAVAGKTCKAGGCAARIVKKVAPPYGDRGR